MTLMGAINQLQELQSAEDMPIYYKPVIAEVINVLLMDTQEVKHGHWEYRTRHQRDCVASCSVCRKRTTFFFKNGTKYCPFCGAKMDEGEE